MYGVGDLLVECNCGIFGIDLVDSVDYTLCAVLVFVF